MEKPLITASDPVRVPYQLDEGPGRYRLGLIVLASDNATEQDFMNMRPHRDVTIYTSRVRNVNPVTIENLTKMAPLLTESTASIAGDLRLDAVAYSCTSGTLAIGYDRVAETIHAARPGVPVITPMTAAIAAFEALKVKRVAVLTPYIDDINLPMAAYIREHGPEVVGFTAFQIEDDNDMARVPPEAIYQAGLQADRAEAEALFISCTALRAAEVVERLEQALGKPVVTSIQAMFWQSLRDAGCTDPVTGYGCLMEKH
ncbi:MAG: aspartate/glutamate racemase family protein [Pseudomonadota bacterium]